MNKDIAKIGQEMILLGTYEDYELDEILQVLKAADDLYYNDEQSFLEDNEYDALRKYAEHLEPHHLYFTGVGSDIRGGKVKLPHEMGSLDQVDIGEITEWVGNWTLQKQFLIATDKLDGTSSMLIYGEDGHLRIAYSRGNGIEGADITRHLRRFKSIPKNIGCKAAIRGEIILSKKNFKILRNLVKTRGGQLYKNARNMVAGLMNSEKIDDVVYDYIDFVSYEILNTRVSKTDMLCNLRDMGFNVPYWTSFQGNELTDATLAAYLTDRRGVTEYEIDGLVIDVDSAMKRDQMNPTRSTLNPAYAIKYKVADDSNQAVATVVCVHWRPSKHGYLKPRVEIEPIDLVGVTIQYATGFNAKFIRDNNIGPCAKITITRSGDVIPFLQEVIQEADKPQLPAGECGVDWDWNDTGVDVVMLEHNDEVMINRITDFFMAIDAPHLRKGSVTALYEHGIKTIEDIIKLPEKRLVGIIGANGSKIYKGLKSKLTNIPLYVLLGAHASARGIGIRKMKKLQQVFGAEGLYKGPSVDDIVLQDGFDRKTAQKVVRCIDDFALFYTTVHDYVTIAEDTSPSTEGSMVGEKIVFTGFRDKDLAARVEMEGGEIQNSVSGKTTILVSSDPTSNTGKMKKAHDLGVRVMGIEEFKEII